MSTNVNGNGNDNDDDDAAVRSSEFEFEPITVTSEFEPIDSQQLSLGNASTVGTARSSKFAATTTVRDVRRGVFRDGRDPSIEHVGVVVVLCFEFGVYYRPDRVSIKMEVDEAADIDGQAQQPSTSNPEAELRIKARYPREARGPSTEKPVTQTIAGVIEPSVGSVSVGSVRFERSTTRVQRGATAALSSAIVGDLSVAWSLEGDRNKIINNSSNNSFKGAAGVPGSLACAVLLQTDCIPFEISVEFTAPLFGRLYRAKPKIVISQNHLWERRGRDPWEAASEWRDFDSDAFGDWIQRKTRNEWAEMVLY
ncbi:uncharacterized protein B0T15DRAFT_490493 [Chaetomium strumarium]|uniref:Uncharacterized protein n=1 Tax=Chaetomium strumarium TaxID=1170767 RepID=A0AAJ0GXB0_9PEZI|nr:hypothetical protein B0T15DRAFT_490493 [Chaetomium strumarium]